MNKDRFDAVVLGRTTGTATGYDVNSDGVGFYDFVSHSDSLVASCSFLEVNCTSGEFVCWNGEDVIMRGDVAVIVNEFLKAAR